MKKNLKAIVSIILVLGLLVCLTGCGEECEEAGSYR